MNIIQLLTFVFTLLVSLSGFAHGEKIHHDMTPPDSLAISVVLDTQGNLWRVGVSDGFVELSKSNDLGKTFSKPVKVNSEQPGYAEITARTIYTEENGPDQIQIEADCTTASDPLEIWHKVEIVASVNGEEYFRKSFSAKRPRRVF